jgi:hypothetical protein
LVAATVPAETPPKVEVEVVAVRPPESVRFVPVAVPMMMEPRVVAPETVSVPESVSLVAVSAPSVESPVTESEVTEALLKVETPVVALIDPAFSAPVSEMLVPEALVKVKVESDSGFTTVRLVKIPLVAATVPADTPPKVEVEVVAVRPPESVRFVPVAVDIITWPRVVAPVTTKVPESVALLMVDRPLTETEVNVALVKVERPVAEMLVTEALPRVVCPVTDTEVTDALPSVL